jgi:hypothetical protein
MGAHSTLNLGRESVINFLIEKLNNEDFSNSELEDIMNGFLYEKVYNCKIRSEIGEDDNMLTDWTNNE